MNNLMTKKRDIKQTSLFADSCSVLDATLRDAGYLNDWAFSRDEIFTVVGAVAKAGVEATDVGYISDNPTRHPAARCDVDLLRSLREHTFGRINLAVMLSLSEPDPETLFQSRQDVLDLIRMPCTIDQVDEGLRVAEIAQQYGIASSINIVNISTLRPQQLADIADKVQQAKVADMLYLADSRGACRPKDIKALVEAVRTHWTGILGFHAHANTGFASVNSWMALESGCQLIDGTVNGLGLGSGNTKLQHAMTLVQQKQADKPYRYEPLDQLKGFDVPMPAEKSYLYYLVGAKNFAQLWVEPLLERYGDQTARYLQAIPSRDYSRIEQVIDEVEQVIEHIEQTVDEQTVDKVESYA